MALNSYDLSSASEIAPSTLRYVMYARKSSEEKTRQVQSIEDQIAALHPLIEQGNLNVVATLTESKSAKEPGRPVFAQMMSLLKNGKADAVLCWHLNRLSRNEIDSGTVRWLLRQGTIREIVTPMRTYRPEDNALITAVESAMGEQFIVELKANTQRGVQSKVAKGWFPGRVPQGYKNDVLTHTIVRDPDRWDMVKQAWSEILTGRLSVPQIAEKMTDEWGYRSPGGVGAGMPRNTLYRIFTNPFYTGVFEWEGRLYPGKHEVMISTTEWQLVQSLLGRVPGKPERRNRTRRFSYSGLIVCGHCGRTVCADRKRKVLKYTGEERFHTYYACSRSGKGCPLSGRVRESEIDDLLRSYLEGINLPKDFEEFAQKVAAREREEERQEDEVAAASRARAMADALRENEELLTLRLRGLINDVEFVRRKQELGRQQDVLLLSGRKAEESLKSNAAIDRAERAAALCVYGTARFVDAATRDDPDAMRTLAREVAPRYVLRRGKIVIEPDELLSLVTGWVREQKKIALPAVTTFEPVKISFRSVEKAHLKAPYITWGALWDAMRTKSEQI